ncbi:MAG: hypothetical protein QOE26_857 [Verrucomicrobiota bacterium]
MKTWRRFWLVAAGYVTLASGTIFGQEFAETVLFPKDKPVMELDFPAGFKSAFRKDGTYLAVGPKSVMALVAWGKVKDAAAVKSGLPEFAKSFLLRSLSFREVNTPSVTDAKLSQAFDEQEHGGAKMLTATGKNSDGDEMFVSATAFPWKRRYYVLFAVCKPADKEQLEKDRLFVERSVNEINDD